MYKLELKNNNDAYSIYQKNNEFYTLEQFKNGKNTKKEIKVEEVIEIINSIEFKTNKKFKLTT